MIYDFFPTGWHSLARALLLYRRWVSQTAQPAGMDGAAGMGRLPRKFQKRVLHERSFPAHCGPTSLEKREGELR